MSYFFSIRITSLQFINISLQIELSPDIDIVKSICISHWKMNFIYVLSNKKSWSSFIYKEEFYTGNLFFKRGFVSFRHAICFFWNRFDGLFFKRKCSNC